MNGSIRWAASAGASDPPAGFEQVVNGSWAAIVIGVLLVVAPLLVSATVAARIRRQRRHRRSHARAAAGPPTGHPAATPPEPGSSRPRPTRTDRCALLTAEALVVRDRLAGHIDAPTYRSRMHDLARGRRP